MFVSATKRAPEAAELRLSGPMSGEQKLGEGLRELPLVGSEPRTKGSRKALLEPATEQAEVAVQIAPFRARPDSVCVRD